MEYLAILAAFVLGYLAGNASARERIQSEASKAVQAIREATEDRTIRRISPKIPVSQEQETINQLEHEARQN